MRAGGAQNKHGSINTACDLSADQLILVPFFLTPYAISGGGLKWSFPGLCMHDCSVDDTFIKLFEGAMAASYYC
jgi:hypothetical protein